MLSIRQKPKSHQRDNMMGIQVRVQTESDPISIVINRVLIQ